mgnify:CR=1 FL=1
MGEGDGGVAEDDGGVDVDCGDDDGPAAFRRHRERGGQGPPPSSSSLTSSLDGRRVSPLFLVLHGMGGARAPPRLDLSLYFSLVLCSVLALFHRFVYIWRYVTPIGLKPSP